MSEFTLTLIKLAFLAVLWLFVIAAVGVIRADLFGSKAATKAATRAAQPRPAKAARQPKPPRAQCGARGRPDQAGRRPGRTDGYGHRSH